MFFSLTYSFYNIRFGIITLIYDKTKILSEVNVEQDLLILLSLIVRGRRNMFNPF